MSMMMPPDPAAAGGMPLPPGGGPPEMPMPPMDAMSAPAALPAEGGIEGLMAALGGGGGLGPEGPLPDEMPLGMEGEMPPEEEDPLDGPGHIQQAIKHLMLAMVANDDEEQSAGIVKGMGPLQALLGGEQKKSKILADAGG